MDTIISYLIAIAVAAFVLSLPIRNWRAGVALRRLAALCAVLALLPALVAIIAQPNGSSGGAGIDGIGGIDLLVSLAMLSVVAWAFLAVRRRFAGGRDKPRTTMMRRYRHRTDNDLLDFLERFNKKDRNV